jgi:lipopolysaccharide transport protein LptA
MCKAANRTRISIIATLLALVLPLFAADERFALPTSGDTVTLRSDEAWEDERDDVIHFSGHFELKGSDWYLSGDQATLYGKLDDPETVILNGDPSMIRLMPETGGETKVISGTARRIVYQRDNNRLLMEGNASLTRDNNTMQSGDIEYDFENDSLRAGGSEGVEIKFSAEE